MKAKRKISTWILLGNRRSCGTESYGDTNCSRGTRCGQQRTGKRFRGIGNKSTSGDHPNYSTGKIGQNTEKSPGDLR